MGDVRRHVVGWVATGVEIGDVGSSMRSSSRCSSGVMAVRTNAAVAAQARPTVTTANPQERREMRVRL